MTLQKGAKVKVVREGLLTTGHIGIIEDWYNVGSVTTVQVYFPDGRSLHYNSLSLENIDEAHDTNKENNITKGDNENMLMGTYKVATIKFLEGKNTNTEYYSALFDNEIYSGDTVVVMSAHNGMGIAVVTDIVEEPTSSMIEYCNAGREIIAKFDMSAYETRKENRKKAQELKVQMDKKVKELEKVALYEMMAEKSPELKEMLDAYKGLVG